MERSPRAQKTADDFLTWKLDLKTIDRRTRFVTDSLTWRLEDLKTWRPDLKTIDRSKNEFRTIAESGPGASTSLTFCLRRLFNLKTCRLEDPKQYICPYILPKTRLDNDRPKKEIWRTFCTSINIFLSSGPGVSIKIFLSIFLIAHFWRFNAFKHWFDCLKLILTSSLTLRLALWWTIASFCILIFVFCKSTEKNSRSRQLPLSTYRFSLSLWWQNKRPHTTRGR